MLFRSCSVVYTGTHDNATLQGWLLEASQEEITMIADYLKLSAAKDFSALQDMKNNGSLCKNLIELAMSSVADFAIIPLQDIYTLDNTARMNTPSTSGGQNWKWRMSQDQFSKEKALWLKGMSEKYKRN